MREIGAFEAKNKLGQLLDWVEAKLVTPSTSTDHEQARGAAARIRARRGINIQLLGTAEAGRR